MYRRRGGSRRYIKPVKRNANRIIRAGAMSFTSMQQQVVYTWTATEACTVKSIKLDLGAIDDAGGQIVIPYVLVRIPEGYGANTITFPALTDDMYNPTDQVLMSGVLTDSTSEDHKFNAIGRKMKPGDRLGLVCKNHTGTAPSVAFEISFSVLT